MTKYQFLTGITSKHRDKHFILVDYDRIKKENLLRELKWLQKRFNYPTFYVFRTSKGHYSAVCFKLISFRNYILFLLKTSCCKNFLYFTFKDKKATMRLSKKIDKKSSKLILIDELKNNIKESDEVKNSFFKILRWINNGNN